MAIYSTHPSRGKFQILSASESHRGWESETVTSLDDADQAREIVKLLNRVVGLAWAPQMNFDMDYPRDHWEAVVDRSLRPDLLHGETDVWYEFVKACLYYSLQRLEVALEPLPKVVAAAIDSELQTERACGDNDRYSGRVGGDGDLFWETDPKVMADFEGLGRELTARAITDIRLLLEAEAASGECQLEVLGSDHVELSNWAGTGSNADDLRFVEIQMTPSRRGRRRWTVAVYQCDDGDAQTELDPGNEVSSTAVATCHRDEAPSVEEAVELFRLANLDGQLARWAETPIGEELRGTPFVVSE